MPEGALDRPIRVVVPIITTRRAGALIAVAARLLLSRGGQGSLLGIVEVATNQPISRGVTVARRYRSLLNRITAAAAEAGAAFGVEVRVSHHPVQAIREAAYEAGADVLVVEWPHAGLRPADLETLRALISDPPADLVMVRPGPDGVPEHIDTVLVPVRGGPSARLALRAAEALAEADGAALSVMHVYRPNAGPERRRREADHFHLLTSDVRHPTLNRVEVESDRPAQAIFTEGARHQVVVLGAQAEQRRSGLAATAPVERVVRRLPGTVLVVKSGGLVARAEPFVDSFASRTISDKQVSARVDRWFAENTYQSREFRDLARLVQLKQRLGVSISVGLPALNEEATIGPIVRRIREHLVERHRLVDELVVIDSGSTDRTVQIASAAGVPVVQHPAILPEYGSFKGKGEALWKSLHQLKGDIVAWCDTDISNFHPRFIYGVLGPLLVDPRVGYVKGFYKRPLKFGTELQTAGGGRVTELTARPVINLFYPELSGLLQPLSGEYAGRRHVLEQMPFFTGYGVEIGLLIDILDTYGLNSIAQVDLGMRIHRNQELFDLSRMAFAILQVAVKRLGDRHRMHLVEELNRSMKLIHYDRERYFLEVRDIQDHERPPLRSVPEYIARRHEIPADRPSAAAQPNPA